MAEQLTQEQLLLLDNLMYLQDVTDIKYKTIEDLISDYETGEILLCDENLSGGFENHIDQMEQVLEAIKNDPQLMALGIERSTQPQPNADGVKEELIRATCFTQYDESRKNVVGHIVAFRGTGGVYNAWKDNFEGLYEADTEAQLQAAQFIEELGYEDITVTGHSKGGNLAMYTTVTCGSQIQRCVSYDGQGFGEAFQNKYGGQIDIAEDKITSISADNDFVNILLDPIAATNVYVENDGILVDGHSSFYLWKTNEAALEANGGNFIGSDAITKQSKLMSGAHDKLTELIDFLGADEEEAVADVSGALLAKFLSKDSSWDKMFSDIKENAGEYLDQKKEDAKRIWGYIEEDVDRLFETEEEKKQREAEEAAIQAAKEAEEQAMEEAMKAYREELDQSYILHTAMVVCDKAYTNEAVNPSYIVLPTSHGETIHGQPMLTVEDYKADVNVLNFGICRSTQNPSVLEAARNVIKEVQEETDTWLDKVLGIFVDKSKTEVSTDEQNSLAAHCAGVCKPIFIDGWINGKQDVLIDGKPALIGSCTLCCQYGGTITIQTSGQLEE